MANVIADNYKDYKKTIIKFEEFHNNVINMPRARFSDLRDVIQILKSLASYIILFGDEALSQATKPKEIYKKMFDNYKNGVLPESNRNLEFEREFLDVNGVYNTVYETLGRRFRHYTEYLSFFEILNGENKLEKFFDKDALEELVLTTDEHLFDIFRNKMLNINIKNNSYIKTLQGIRVNEFADYRPARAIISYCNAINRPVTAFEVAFLLGRVDNIQTEKDILYRAITIGKKLPSTSEKQKQALFGSMDWKTRDGVYYEYTQSQNPDFKFKPFILFMDAFGLIDYQDSTGLITLTPYSKELAKEDIPFDVLDLEKLLVMVDDDTEDSNALLDIIIRKRTDAITVAIKEDGELVFKLNKRALRNPIIKNGKRKRNRLIAELAKVKSNYLDEVTQKETFEGANGRNYVEAHHLIEFSKEHGPDITDNLICLGPENHSLIHHGSSCALDNFYRTCMNRGIITFERWKNICVKYRCLTKEHVKILQSKKLISDMDANELNALIDKYGVDPVFLQSLNIEAIEDSN